MADNVGVFIQTDKSLEKLAEEVGCLLELKFEHQKDDYDEWYAVRTGEGLYDIGVHGLDNDRDMNFEDYQYEVRFWENTDNSPEERERLQKVVGRKIFERLKSTKKYPLMLVFDVQHKLDEYHP